MNLILFDDDVRIDLLPLTFTRPAAEQRVGILTIRQKWELYFDLPSTSITENYLSEKYPAVFLDDNLLINGRLLPDEELVSYVKSLDKGEAIVKNRVVLAARLDEEDSQYMSYEGIASRCKLKEISGKINMISKPWDIFKLNGVAIHDDFKLITAERTSEAVGKSNFITGKNPVFIEKGASIAASMINTTDGPVYIGKNATVMEGCMLRGGLALCEGAVLKMGAKVYGASTIGPFSKVGGEVNNVVIQGYSNKAHDGFLGNSVIGEWCNLGADTNNSNLKNNYAEVKLWSYRSRRFEPTGLQFCGLIMGDHSKSGINTMFNTGTVVGVSANIFGSGFPRNFIPDFSWGGASGITLYKLDKALEVAQAVMKRRNVIFTHVERQILTAIYELTKSNREQKF